MFAVKYIDASRKPRVFRADSISMLAVQEKGWVVILRDSESYRTWGLPIDKILSIEVISEGRVNTKSNPLG